MNTAFSFTPGNVTKYSSNSKKSIKHIHSYQVIYGLSFITCLFISIMVFKICINNEHTLSDTIALGSIFATFGSSIVAIFSITLSNIYDRFCTNLNILFDELIPHNSWHRWPFIKRESHSKLYNNELTYQILKNAEICFNVGSHPIVTKLPTVREDFFDLPNWRSFFTMFFEAKNYETFVINNIPDPANQLMVWDCVIDNFKTIIIYKVARLMIVIGESFIVSSIILAFFFSKIPF